MEEWKRQFEEILRANDGLFTHSHMKLCGITRSQLRTKIRNGTWREYLPGVFVADAFPITPERRLRATMLYCGPNHALAGPTAASFLGFWDLWDENSPVHVTVDRRMNSTSSVIEGVTLHRTSRLEEDDLIEKSGLLATRPTRTLIDLCEYGTDADVVVLFADLEQKGMLNSLRRQMERLRAGRDLSLLDELLARTLLRRGPVDSPGEAIADHIFCSAGFIPARQYRVRAEGDGYRFDFAFPELRLAFEADGYKDHRNKYYADRDRDAAVAADGWLTIRITWPQLMNPAALRDRLIRIITRRAEQLGVPLTSLKRNAA